MAARQEIKKLPGPITGRYACENFTLSKPFNKKKFRNSKHHNISLKFLLRIFYFLKIRGSSKSEIPKHPSESVISGIPIGQNKINRLYKNRSSKYPGFCPGFIPFNCLTILRILILTEFGSVQAPTNEFIFT